MNYSIKNIVKDNRVTFAYFRSGVFYYEVTLKAQSANPELEGKLEGLVYETYQFPVPIEDIGESSLNASDKAILFMRWIRKAIEDKTFIRTHVEKLGH